MSLLKRHWSSLTNRLRCGPSRDNRTCMTEPVPLSELGRRERITICKLSSDRKTCARMNGLGLYPGARGELLCCGHEGQCILHIHGSSLCLDRCLADQIFVAVTP